MNWRLRYQDTNVPCYGCQKRFSECHAKCKEYAKYAKKQDLKREAALAVRDVNDYIRDSINRQKRRARK